VVVGGFIGFLKKIGLKTAGKNMPDLYF